MKCNICGRDYQALGVHLRRKHKIAPKDYKEECGMLLATPLVEDWLSKRISASQTDRLKDPEYKVEVTRLCAENSRRNIGKPGVGMTKAGKASIAKSDKLRNDKYLTERAQVVASILQEKGTMADVRRAIGTGAVAGKKMAALAGVEYTRESAKVERDKRAAETIRAKALARVEKVMPYFKTTKSAAEMCRLAGISIKTYKNWLAAGLISRHPNGTGPRK